jgi:peptidoglycan/LPS O-acetylase OafA/YrhL
MADEVSRDTTDGGTPLDRRPEIDWLRAFAVLMLVPFHAALIFCTGRGYYIGPGDHYLPLRYLILLISPWHMPILFVLSGMATWFALRHRSPREYAWERTKRLFVPLVFGTFVLVPPMVYLQRLCDGRFEGSYLAFYPHFFEGFWPAGNFTYAHLWFIAYLWVYSLVALSVFALLRGSGPRRFVDRLAAGCLRHRGAILLLAAPMAVSESLLHARFPWNWIIFNDWAMFTWYLLLFVLGYVLCSDERFWRAIERDGPIALVLALIATSLGISRYVMELWISPAYSFEWIQLMVFGAFRTWFCVVAILWTGAKLLRFYGRLLPYVREASYPFYVLHHVVLIGIGYSLAYWDLHVLVRFALLVVATVVGTILAYDLFVRRFRVVRFLFGLRLRPQREDLQEVVPDAVLSR